MPFPVGHFEIGVKNIKQAVEFYSKLFDWKIQIFDDGHYAMIYPDENGIAGGLNPLDSDTTPYTAIFVNVDDIEASMKQVLRLGGSLVQEKTKIETGQGYFAVVNDPDGIRLGLWSES